MHYRLLEPHLVLLCCILVTKHHELIDAATDAAKGCWESCLSQLGGMRNRLFLSRLVGQQTNQEKIVCGRNDRTKSQLLFYLPINWHNNC